MLGGGIVVLLSLFLPRFSFTDSAGITTNISGLSTAVIWILVLSGFAIAHGLQGLRPGTVRFQLGSPVVTGTIGHVANQGIRLAEMAENAFDDVDVGLLGAAANVVNLS